MVQRVRLVAIFASLFFALTAHAASWQTERLGGFSSVFVYNPSTQSPVGEGRALLIVLHGCAQSNTVFKTAGLHTAADKWGMVIAAPMVVKGAGIASCWEYWTPSGTNHNRTSNDHKRVLDLVAAMKANSSYNIDPNQVYVAGLSSGASFAHVTACIAPDVFAGFGSFAGPSPGTSSNGALSTFETANVASVCDGYSTSYSTHFDTQVASLAQGEGSSSFLTTDGVVSKQYLDQNANGMAKLYGVDSQKGSQATKTNFGGSVKETLWASGRVSRVSVPGLGHAWPGGSGASGSYVDGASGFNYGDYLGAYFSENNMRVSSSGNSGNTGTPPTPPAADLTPTLSNLSVAVNATMGTATISGTVNLAQGTTLQNIIVDVGGAQLSGGTQTNFSVMVNVAAGQMYTAVIAAVARDNAGKTYTATGTKSFQVPNATPVEPEPPVVDPQPPVVEPQPPVIEPQPPVEPSEPTPEPTPPSSGAGFDWCSLFPWLSSCTTAPSEPTPPPSEPTPPQNPMPENPSLCDLFPALGSCQTGEEPPVTPQPMPEPQEPTPQPQPEPVDDGGSSQQPAQPVSEGDSSSGAGGGGSFGFLMVLGLALVGIRKRA